MSTFFYKVYDICIISAWSVKNPGLPFKTCLRSRSSKWSRLSFCARTIMTSYEKSNCNSIKYIMMLSLLPQVDGEIYKAKLFYHPLPPASAPNSRATSATSRFNSQLDLTTGKRKLQDILYMWTHNFFVCHAHPFFSLNFSYK